jgi:hypothetical protein
MVSGVMLLMVDYYKYTYKFVAKNAKGIFPLFEIGFFLNLLLTLFFKQFASYI